METFVQALIVAFREELEAFLIIAILLKFMEKATTKIQEKCMAGNICRSHCFNYSRNYSF